MHTCRPQGATLCKVLSLKHAEIYPTDNISYVIKKVCMTEPQVPMHTCRPQGATLCKVLSLKHTEIYPTDNISYVIKNVEMMESKIPISTFFFSAAGRLNLYSI